MEPTTDLFDESIEKRIRDAERGAKRFAAVCLFLFIVSISVAIMIHKDRYAEGFLAGLKVCGMGQKVDNLPNP